MERVALMPEDERGRYARMLPIKTDGQAHEALQLRIRGMPYHEIAERLGAEEWQVAEWVTNQLRGLRGEEVRNPRRTKARRGQVLGTDRALGAIDSLFEASGGRALANGTPLQRAWRDSHAGRVHAANDPERALQMFGASEFGHKIDPGMY
jgi:alkylation response protein AidB-like acyl-CoA dehydrogenase